MPLIPIAPDARKGKPPCGECHIRPGETCDICGAKASSPAEFDASLMEGYTGAAPIAWRKRHYDGEGWSYENTKPTGGWKHVEPLYAAPAGRLECVEHIIRSVERALDCDLKPEVRDRLVSEATRSDAPLASRDTDLDAMMHYALD